MFLSFKDEEVTAGQLQIDFVTPLNVHLPDNRAKPDRPIGKFGEKTTLPNPDAIVHQVSNSC
jgi:hypothetical protein